MTQDEISLIVEWGTGAELDAGAEALIKRLAAEREKLLDALIKYGEHDAGCETWNAYPDEVTNGPIAAECTCEVGAAIAFAEEASGEQK